MVDVLNEKTFDEAIKNNKKVFVDFYADWCGPCRAMGPVVEELSNELEDVKFFKVDCDENEELCVRFRITSIPCFLIFKDGNLTNRFVGMRDKESFKEALWVMTL